METALFVEPPDTATLRQYPHIRAFGVAGNCRAMSPAQMDAALPAVFQSLRAHRPAIVHYKTCSTFDSSPQTGSIGRAIDLGQAAFSNRFLPLVVGVPQLQRFCVFGNLFARSGLDSEIYRLDRHPTMRRHPVTPMTEADLRLHLAQQTTRPIALIDTLTLNHGYQASRDLLQRLTADPGRVVLFDTLTTDHLALVGRLIQQAQSQEQKPQFAVGSSGVEYALTSHWHEVGAITKPSRLASEKPAPVDRVLVVSGSCSPVSRRQIAWALENGFHEVRLDAARLRRSPVSPAELADLVAPSRSQLDLGRSVIVHAFPSLTDPADGASESSDPAVRSDEALDQRLSQALAHILRELLQAAPVGRIAVVGGDTSGRVARLLGIESLQMLAPLAPGAPLCVARSRDPAIDRLEVVFKGGQVGYDDFFRSLLGGPACCSSLGAIP